MSWVWGIQSLNAVPAQGSGGGEQVLPRWEEGMGCLCW